MIYQGNRTYFKSSGSVKIVQKRSNNHRGTVLRKVIIVPGLENGIFNCYSVTPISQVRITSRRPTLNDKRICSGKAGIRKILNFIEVRRIQITRREQSNPDVTVTGTGHHLVYTYPNTGNGIAY
jgi:hypothetical protein